MATFTYTAKRNIKSGHSIDTDYTITSILQADNDDQAKAIKNVAQPLSGPPTTTLHRIETYRDIVTAHIQTSGGTPDVEDFDEFFHSVAGGETFVFNDGADRDAIISSKAQRTRVGLFFYFAFKIRLI